MLSKFFEDVFLEAKRKGRSFYVDKEVLVSEFGADENGEITETRYPIKLGSYVENVIIIAEGAGIRTVEKLRIENPLPNGELTNVEDWLN